MSDNHTLYNWLQELETTGINIISHAPQTEGVVRQIAGKVAYLKSTNYG